MNVEWVVTRSLVDKGRASVVRENRLRWEGQLLDPVSRNARIERCVRYFDSFHLTKSSLAWNLRSCWLLRILVRRRTNLVRGGKGQGCRFARALAERQRRRKRKERRGKYLARGRARKSNRPLRVVVDTKSRGKVGKVSVM